MHVYRDKMSGFSRDDVVSEFQRREGSHPRSTVDVLTPAPCGHCRGARQIHRSVSAGGLTRARIETPAREPARAIAETRLRLPRRPTSLD